MAQGKSTSRHCHRQTKFYSDFEIFSNLHGESCPKIVGLGQPQGIARTKRWY